MPWEPLAGWGPLDSDFDELSPPSNNRDILITINTSILVYQHTFIVQNTCLAC